MAILDWLLDTIRGLKCDVCGERRYGADRLELHARISHWGEKP